MQVRYASMQGAPANQRLKKRTHLKIYISFHNLQAGSKQISQKFRKLHEISSTHKISVSHTTYTKIPSTQYILHKSIQILTTRAHTLIQSVITREYKNKSAHKSA